MGNIILKKHDRANHIIRMKNLRKSFNAFIDMVKVLKQLRVNSEVLRKNNSALNRKEAVIIWFKRS